LKILAEVGLIRTQKGKGSFVLTDDNLFHPDSENARIRAEYREKFLASSRARLMFEPEIAKQAALSASDKDIADLRKFISVKAPTSAGEQNFDEFHRGIVKILGNVLLIDFFDGLFKLESESPLGLVLIPPENQKAVSAELNRQHKNILQALADKNPEFAYFHMKEYMTYLLAVYEDYFAKFY
jgi:GntR family transcriptional repressor for pyruvate dehydrogenase complex